MLAAAASSSSGGGNFLVPNGTIIVEFVIFVVVLGVIAKFVLPPLQQAVDARDAAVRAALLQGDESRSEAARLDAERLEVLAGARSAARALVEGATRAVEARRADARARGQVEFDRLVAAAEAQLAVVAAEVRAEVAARLETVIVAGAERVIGVRVDPARHRPVFETAAAALDAPVARTVGP